VGGIAVGTNAVLVGSLHFQQVGILVKDFGYLCIMNWQDISQNLQEVSRSLDIILFLNRLHQCIHMCILLICISYFAELT
jgi:hypothetical protein